MKVNISGINKAELLAALYNESRVQGMGIFQATGRPMTKEEAQSILGSGQTYFDYLHGKVMKIDLSGDEVMTHLYNRDNGPGAAEEIIENLKSITHTQK